uniref:ATP synthase F0 subunit 8 n=1 Tax=Dicranocentrus wangi TaxID=1302322 RepID=A0A6H0EX90_9HEXA|nr:ATP synthase F0 subunit 8 [Dicranocentrus wangi]QIT06435.1 ATP synthase F0 subunit 8 [Dicranocentrus wangi]
MPQMSPLMWSWLFILFSIILVLSMNKIYFLNKEIKIVYSMNSETSSNKLSWLW